MKVTRVHEYGGFERSSSEDAPVPEAGRCSSADVGMIDTQAINEAFLREYAELWYQHTESQVVDSSQFERAFGLRATPMEEALRTTVDWFRATVH